MSAPTAGSTAHEERKRTHASAWVPTTDIFAQGDELVIRVELAGVDPADVELRFANGVLTVSGTRNPEFGTSDGDEPKFYVRERFYGEFRRSITLPEGTQPNQIQAAFDDGLVEIVVAGAVRRPTPPASSCATVPGGRPAARSTDCSGAGSRAPNPPDERELRLRLIAPEIGQELDLDEARLRKRA